MLNVTNSSLFWLTPQSISFTADLTIQMVHDLCLFSKENHDHFVFPTPHCQKPSNVCNVKQKCGIKSHINEGFLEQYSEWCEVCEFSKYCLG